METGYVFGSLTRISPLPDLRFDVEPLPHELWATGDYVVAEVLHRSSPSKFVELRTGRTRDVLAGDLIVGALGVRRATLEVTGTWKEVGADGGMQVLTGAGLLGKRTSASPFVGSLIQVTYRGHVLLEREKTTMRQFVPERPWQAFELPVILIVGTSMSAGKTAAAKVIIRQLKKLGKKVVGMKLTGAGRYRDILAMQDAGADWVFDFVDVGLPSTVCPPDEYREILYELLTLAAGAGGNVAVAEIGSSPLEPYNGAEAIAAIKDRVRSTVLCASDPYAAYGVMNAFKMYPSFVTGIATNTLAGIDLVHKLCGVRALNLYDAASLPELDAILEQELTSFVSSPIA